MMLMLLAVGGCVIYELSKARHQRSASQPPEEER